MMMKSISNGILPILLWAGTCATAVAQEYRYEIGAIGGLANYMGDANPSNLLHGLNPAGGLVFRNNLNFRWALSSNIMVAEVYDDTKNVENVFPGHAQTAFKNVFMEVAEHIEFNFLPYSDKFAYLDTYRFTPYVFAGLGATIIRGENGFFGIQVPLGLGVRYKVKNRLNVGVEWAVHQLFSDDFDGGSPPGTDLNDPYKTNSGLFKNMDRYNTIFVSFTWDFDTRDKRCKTYL